MTPLFNGNISETFWRTAGDNKRKKYGYQYDNLNRLTNAIYQDPAATLVTNSYNESISYDKNGNIQTLNRKGYLATAPALRSQVNNFKINKLRKCLLTLREDK